jgi:DNA-binding beta-propeller fold protein YncE
MQRSLAYSLVLLATIGATQKVLAEAPDGPYKVVNSVTVGGDGGFDYVLADSDGRRLYIPRSGGSTSRVSVFDLDTLKPVGEIPKAEGVRGVAVDSKSHHGFTSSKPVLMFDTETLATLKTIDVQGSPDGILFDPATERVFVFSHRAPNATVIDSKDGAIIDTIDLGGAPEQGVSDGNGRIYVDIEDKDNVAVVDSKTLKVISHYELGDKGKAPAGLAMDAKNHILFACCRNPQSAVVLDADTGKIVTSVPIGVGVDGANFNPNTQEVFTSQRDGTLTVIKENSPTSFEVEQNVKTKVGAKTSTLDKKTNQIYLITAEQAPAAAGGGKGTGRWLPNSFMVLVVGK